MADQDNTILLELRLNATQYKEEQRLARESLQSLALSIDRTKEAQKQLAKQREAGKLTDEAWAQQSVKLREQLRGQVADQRAVEKGLLNSQKGYTAAAGSIDSLKARAAELSTVYNALSKQERTATDEGQRLTAELLEVNQALLGGGVAVNDFRRNVGNYPDGRELTGLIQQLVKLQEQQKLAEQGSIEYVAAARQIGFVQNAAVQAGAKQGLTYEQTTTKIVEQSAAIVGATAELVKLEAEQEVVGKQGGEAYSQLGFRIAALNKEIQSVPTETKKVGESIAELDQTTGVFGGQVGTLSQRFTQAKQAVEASKLGLTGLKGAIASTGIGVLILALGVLFEYFTQSDEGAEDLAAGLAYLKGAFSVLQGVGISAGKGLALVFKDPKEAGKEFIGFLENQVVNRVKAFGVLWNAIRKGDTKGLTDGLIQITTGLENGTARAKAFTVEMQRAAGVAQDLSRASDQLDDAQRASLVTLEKNKNLVDKLVLSARDRSLSEQERLQNLDKASQLERESLETTTKLAKEKLRIQQLENAEAERTGKISDEQRDKAAQAEAEVVKLAGQSASLQQTIANRRSALIEQQTAEDKAAAEKARQAAEKALEQKLADQRAQLKYKNDLIDLELRKIKAGSSEELSLLQQKLNNERSIELAQRNVTAGQKQLIDLKYNADSLALLVDFQRRASLTLLQAEQERNAASLELNAKAQAERASQGLRATEQQLAEQYQLQGRAVVLERELALASLEVRKDNSAAELRLRAEANQKLAALDAAQSDAARQRRAKELSDEAQQYTLLADGMLAGHNQAEQQLLAATETYKQQRISAAEAETDDRLALVEKGSQEEANIRLEFANKLKQIQQDSSQAQLDLVKAQTEKVAAIVTSSLSSLAAIQDADTQAKLARIDAEENKATTSVARKAVLEKQKVRIEQQAAEERKKIARAQAVVNLAAGIMEIISQKSVFPSPAAEIVKAAEIAAATAAAYAQFRAIDNAKFAQGGIVNGPSHSRGGVQMWHRSGVHVGEMEGGEAIMSVGAVKKFGGLLSHLNVLGGGKPFGYLSQALAIPARYAEGGVVSSSIEFLPQIKTGGIAPAQIDYDALAAAMAARPADHEALADTLASKLATQLTPAFVAGARALPPQSVNLTELRERNTQLDQREAQTNI
jgi:hypothetical protein